jgi:hypothetical protein
VYDCLHNIGRVKSTLPSDDNIVEVILKTYSECFASFTVDVITDEHIFRLADQVHRRVLELDADEFLRDWDTDVWLPNGDVKCGVPCDFSDSVSLQSTCQNIATMPCSERRTCCRYLGFCSICSAHSWHHYKLNVFAREEEEEELLNRVFLCQKGH